MFSTTTKEINLNKLWFHFRLAKIVRDSTGNLRTVSRSNSECCSVLQPLRANKDEQEMEKFARLPWKPGHVSIVLLVIFTNGDS